MNETNRNEQANELIDDILRRAEAREAAPAPRLRKTDGKWLGRFLALALPLLTVVTLGNVAVLYRPVGPPDVADRDGLRFELYLVAREIEQFRESTGELPESLAELGFDDPEVTYEPDGGAFTLSANDEGMIVNYKPGHPDDVRYAAELARLSGPSET